MGLFKNLSFAFLIWGAFLEGGTDSSQILFLMHNGDPSAAIDRYFELYEKTKEHDFELLQELSIALIEQGWRSRDLEAKVLALFGAGISASEKAISILREGLNSREPQFQLIALNLLARQQNDLADEGVKLALGSPYPLIRMEALYYLAQNKDKHASEQAEALMSKFPNEIKPVFPKIFALFDDPRSTKILRKLLNDPSERVRLETILSIGEMQRDDLLPQIRRIATQRHHAIQEACATVLGNLNDTESLELLKRITNSSSEHVKIAAWKSLSLLGDEEASSTILQAAKEGNLFAIAALADLENTEDTLAALTKDSNLQVRTNAAIALLEKRDVRCLPEIFEVIIEDHRGLAYIKTFSPGASLSFWKAIPAAREKLVGNEAALELSMSMRETILTKILELPEEHFLKAAEVVIVSNRTELIPKVISLLEMLQTTKAIAVLKKYHQQIGAPLLRNYCTLALYRLHEGENYTENLLTLITNQKNFELIRLRPVIPLELRHERTPYQITPEERSRFLIEALESLTAAQNREGVETLLKTIRHGNEKNKYALAGLLARAIQ